MFVLKYKQEVVSFAELSRRLQSGWQAHSFIYVGENIAYFGENIAEKSAKNFHLYVPCNAFSVICLFFLGRIKLAHFILGHYAKEGLVSMSSKIASIVYQIAEPIALEYGVELVDVEYVKEGGQYVLRVFLDKPEGVSLDDCQNVSSRLSDILDAEDPIETAYVLEVSSPGIDRPLKKDADFVRFSGQKIDISTYTAFYGKKKKFTGELVGLEGDKVVVMIDGERLEVPRDQISQVRLAVEF